MHKLGKREYVQKIAKVIRKAYGDDEIKDYGMDVKLAEAIVRSLRPFLCFHVVDISIEDYKKWKQKRDPRCVCSLCANQISQTTGE